MTPIQEQQEIEAIFQNLKIENPCPVVLARLQSSKHTTPDEYYCSSCSNTVVDCRKLPKQEIATLLKTPNFCGIFEEQQLGGQMQKSWWYQIALNGLMILSFLGLNVSPMNAQDTLSTPDTITTPKEEESTTNIDIKNTVEVEKNNKPINRKRRRRRLFKRKTKLMGCPTF